MKLFKSLKDWISENPIERLLGLATFFGLTTYASLCALMESVQNFSRDHIWKPYLEGRTVPLWVFLVVSLCLAYVILRSVVRFFLTKKRGKTCYEGIIWQWVKSKDGDIFVTPLCPKCERELTVAERGWDILRIYCHDRECGFSISSVRDNYPEFQEKAVREIKHQNRIA